MQQLRIGEHTPIAALADIHERRVPAASSLDVAIECVVSEIGARAGKPSKSGIVPVERALPPPEPNQLSRRARPESLRIAPSIINPPLDDWIEQTRHVPDDSIRPGEVPSRLPLREQATRSQALHHITHEHVSSISDSQ